MNELIVFFAGLGLTAIAWLQIRLVGRLTGEQAELTRSLRLAETRAQQLEQELAALCSASMVAGNQLLRMEQQMRYLMERQNKLHPHSPSDRCVARAVQMVDQGADTMQLMESCGLTWGEAELLVMKHRGNG